MPPVCTGRQCVLGAVLTVASLTRSVSNLQRWTEEVFYYLQSGLSMA